MRVYGAYRASGLQWFFHFLMFHCTAQSSEERGQTMLIVNLIILILNCIVLIVNVLLLERIDRNKHELNIIDPVPEDDEDLHNQSH